MKNIRPVNLRSSVLSSIVSATVVALLFLTFGNNLNLKAESAGQPQSVATTTPAKTGGTVLPLSLQSNDKAVLALASALRSTQSDVQYLLQNASLTKTRETVFDLATTGTCSPSIMEMPGISYIASVQPIFGYLNGQQVVTGIAPQMGYLRVCGISLATPVSP